MHRNPETLTIFFSSGTKRLLTFFGLLGFDTKRERHTMFTMLTVPTSPSFNSPAELPGQEFNLH